MHPFPLLHLKLTHGGSRFWIFGLIPGQTCWIRDLKGKNCDSLSASTMLFWPLNRGTRVCLQGSIKLYLNMTHIHTCMLRPVEKTKSSEGCELMSDPDVSAVADYHFIWINVCVCACVCGLLWDQNWSKQSGVFLLVASSCLRLLS